MNSARTSEVEKVAILDAGSQYGKLIDRVVREMNVCSEILPFNTTAEFLLQQKFKAVLLSGGPESVYAATAPAYDPKLFHSGLPVLGICYGMQLLAHAEGGKVEKTSMREDGQLVIKVDVSSPLFSGLSREQVVLLTHGDSVVALPEHFKTIATSQGGLISAISCEERKLYGVQFHPEVQLTIEGKRVLHNFLFSISGLKGDFTLEDRQEKALKYIREATGDKDVLVLVSGGVDSSVCVALVSKALGPSRVKALHVDNGFMRKEESSQVYTALKAVGVSLHVVDATKTFATATTTIKGHPTFSLEQTLQPEEKRKIIGDTFMRVAEEEVKRLGLQPENVYLAQGTLRPDLIESASLLASNRADAIKTHHNDTELVRALREQGRVIEPLKDYHKDEVRALGLELGLPSELVWRQPFPGPGLAIRILCADKPFQDVAFTETNQILAYLLDTQANVSESIRTSVQQSLASIGLPSGLGVDTSTLRATLLPVRTVGVQGDGRSYRHAVALSGKLLSWETAFLLAKFIPQLCHNVNRVVWTFGDAVPGPLVSVTPTYLTQDAVKQLQEADAIVNGILLREDLIRSLGQMPVVLLPVNWGVIGARSIVLRPFLTEDFMTGVAAVPGIHIPLQVLQEMVSRIEKEVKGIVRVMLDLTSKPPGTTEWE